MASKNNISENNQAPDALIISKEVFVEKIQERIKIGSDLHNKGIRNIEQLETLTKEYYKWDSYNSELLKSSFNNEKNKYKHGYCMVDSISVSYGDYNPQRDLEDLKEKIMDKNDYLEQLKDKIELIKCIAINPKINNNNTDFDNLNIFIVHGHDIAIQQSAQKKRNEICA
jgi:hypothetical protein